MCPKEFGRVITKKQRLSTNPVKKQKNAYESGGKSQSSICLKIQGNTKMAKVLC